MEHKIIQHTVEGPKIYCPKTKDIAVGTYTSIGVICEQCKLHIK